jgi:hypothetical protein
MTFIEKSTRSNELDRTANTFTLLVVGPADDLSSNNSGEPVVMHSLRDVVSVLKNERTDQASLLGILTGVQRKLQINNAFPYACFQWENLAA